MDTGGKVATGLLVPLAVVGAVVGGYFVVKGMGGNKKHHTSKAREGSVLASMKDYEKDSDNPFSGGKRRKTHRRRR